MTELPDAVDQLATRAHVSGFPRRKRFLMVDHHPRADAPGEPIMLKVAAPAGVKEVMRMSASGARYLAACLILAAEDAEGARCHPGISQPKVLTDRA